MLAIVHAELVMRDHLVPDAVLFIENGIITGWGEMRNTPIPSGCDILDANGLYVGPGLVDIHLHDCPNERVSFATEPLRAAKDHLWHGTTTLQPTLYFSMTQQELLEAIDRIKAAMAHPEGKNIGGIYMEAPYMNPSFGAERENCPWDRPVCRKDYLPLVERAGDAVRLWTLAPERDNILEFVRDAKAVNPNVRFSVGHSEATPEQIESLIPYGLCVGTHHTNATGTIVNYPECRGVCVDEAVNYNHSIYAEIISDSRGIHVDPYMQRLVRKIKGDDRIILITDCSLADGPIPPGYDGVTDIVFDHTGEISGACMTLNIACRNFMRHTGASLVDVFCMASLNPCQAMGYHDRGQIAIGKRADLVIVDHLMQVSHVLLAGQIIR